VLPVLMPQSAPALVLGYTRLSMAARLPAREHGATMASLARAPSPAGSVAVAPAVIVAARPGSARPGPQSDRRCREGST
jgi:hypothetical protein